MPKYSVNGTSYNSVGAAVTALDGQVTVNNTAIKNLTNGSVGLVQQSAAGKDITVAKDLDGDVVDFTGKKLSDSTTFSRKLTGVAEGTLSATSTDAVSGKQLYATNQGLASTNKDLANTNTRLTTAEGNLSSNTTSITNLQNTVQNISSGSVGLVQQSAAGKDITVAKDLDGDVVDFSGKKLSDSTAISRKLTGLADGTLSATSTDAVTGKQLNATNTRLTTAEGNLSSTTTSITNLQNTVNNISSGSVGLVQQSAAGKDITVAKDLDGDVVDFSGKKLSDSTTFSRKLTGVAEGTLSSTSTDAVSGKQLYTTNQNLADTNKSLAETNKTVSATTTNISNLQNTVNNISSGSVGLVQQSAAGKDITVAKDLDGDVVDFSGKKLSDSTTFSRKLTGLADGTLSATSTDAVSGKQLYTTNQNLANTNTRLTTAEGNLSSTTTSITNLQNTVKNISSGSVGLVQQSAAGKDITVAKDLDGDVVDFTGKKLSDSTAFSRKLTGLADGTLSATSTDAVTGKQLNATNTRLTTAEGNLSSTTTSITNLQNTVNNISSGSVGLVQQSAAGKDITVAKDLDGDVVDFSGKKLSDSTTFSRKLTGVAEGTLSSTSTDAVSGKQLYTTNQNLADTNKSLAETNKTVSATTTNISNLQNTVNNISSGSVGLVQQSAAGKDITVAKDLDGDVVDFSGKKLSDSTTFSRKLTGLADGTLSATSTDAVSGKQLYTTNQNLANTNTRLTTAEGNLSSTTTSITNLQNTVKNISSGSVGLVQQSAAGKDITVAKDLDGDVVDFTGKKLSDSTAFSRKLTGLADGTLSATSTDAVTGKQLNATNTRLTTAEGNLSSTTTSITNLQNTVNNISSGSVGLVQQSAAGKDITVAKDLDGDVVDFSGKKLSDSTTFSRKLTGVAEGTLSSTSTDAVSGKQLYTTNQNLADTNKSLAETNKTVSATTTNISNLQNTVNNISSGSVGLVQQSAAGKDITVAKDLDGDVVDFSGKKLSDSTTFSRKLTGLADGTLSATSTDAVSGKQLYTTNQNLANTNTRLTTAEGNLSSTTTSITNLQNTVKNISSGSVGLVQQSAAGNDITVAKDLDGDVVDFTGKKLSDSTAFSRKLTGLADGTLSATSTDAVTGKQLNATNTRLTTAEGNLSSTTTSITNLQNTVNNISSGSVGLVQQSAAGKDITVAKDLDGDVVDFSGKKLSDSTTFSRKLTGLADGTLSATSTDAVSGKQLYTTNQNLANTNTRLTTAEGNLSSTTTSITNLQNTVKNISSGSVGLVQQSAAGNDITVAKDLDGDVVDFTGKKLSDSTAFSRKLTGLADGTLSATSTDAVSGKQLYTTNQNLANTNTRLTTAEGNLSSTTTSITNLQNTVKNISSGSVGLVQQSAAGNDITVAKDLDGDVVDFTGKKLSDSTAFSRKLTGLADGTLSATSTDAVTGKQLNATNTRLTTAEGNLSSTTTSITNLQNTVNNISSGSVGLVQQSAAGKDITVAKDLDGDVVDFSGKKLSDSTTFSRKLTGLADGTLSATSTDAVSGKQLYTTNQNLANTNTRLTTAEGNLSSTTTSITNLQNTVNNISSGSVGLVQQSAAGNDITVAKDLDGDVVDFTGKKLSDSTAFSRKLTGLADGTLSATSTDAVSGKQLYTTNQNLANTNTRLTTAEGNLSSTTTSITNLQNTVKNISSGSVGLVQQSAAGNDITVAKDLDGDVVDFTGKKLSDSTTFSRKLRGLAEGTLSSTSTDAVSGKQLYTTNQNLATTNQNLADTNKSLAETNKTVSATTTNISNLQNTVNNISTGSVGLVQQSAAGKDITVAKDLDGDVVDFSGKKLSDSTTFSRKLTGLADGTLSATSTDAVTGSQLYATNKNVANVSDNVTNIKNTMNTIVNGGGLKYFHANSTLDDAQATGLESIAFGGAAVAAGMNSMAMGGNARAMAGNAVALGAGSVADRANTVSVGSVGKERQITNVAAGTADTDAVNVAQLKAAGIINGNGKANAAVTYGTKADGSTDYGNVTLGGGNASAGTAIHNVAAGTADTDAVNVRQMNAAIAGVQKVSNTSDPMFVADGDRAVKRAIAQGTHATAMGAAASAGGDQSIAAGHNAQSGGDSSIAMGANAKATAHHAVAMGDGSVADRANTMSVGSAGNERQVTNVAAGVQGTDAVNVSQLSQTVYAAVGDLPAGTTAKQYTDEQVGMVRQGVNQVARGAYSGIAAATALTMIPDVDQGKTIAVGIGGASYKGYQAVALGASARIAQNLKAKMGVGYSSEGTTVGVGASYQW
ncbi:YadA-like family protein [Ralstonia syzygii]|uniref:YadA-like family protein n=1 Tax=Ralstonia syzygii TaxID=28097 RepID=UPI0027E05975|nr:YadA-like family protein [Ralstonia syzygii]